MRSLACWFHCSCVWFKGCVFCIGTVLALAGFGAGAQAEDQIATQAAPEAEGQAFTDPAAEGSVSVLTDGLQLEEAGKLEEALGLYRAWLAEAPADHPDRPRVEERLGQVGVQAVFSRPSSGEGKIHTVRPGDTLYDLAHEYHTTIDQIRKLNGITGDLIRVGQNLKISDSQFSIAVDRSENKLRLLENGQLLKVYPIATGTEGNTPLGDFTIVNKLENPTWFNEGKAYPPGAPENILGTRWLGFSKEGYGIHGTTEPDSIGKAVSHGCVRMFNEDVEEIYSMVPVGISVTIAD